MELGQAFLHGLELGQRRKLAQQDFAMRQQQAQQQALQDELRRQQITQQIEQQRAELELEKARRDQMQKALEAYRAKAGEVQGGMNVGAQRAAGLAGAALGGFGPGALMAGQMNVPVAPGVEPTPEAYERALPSLYAALPPEAAISGLSQWARYNRQDKVEAERMRQMNRTEDLRLREELNEIRENQRQQQIRAQNTRAMMENAVDDEERMVILSYNDGMIDFDKLKSELQRIKQRREDEDKLVKERMNRPWWFDLSVEEAKEALRKEGRLGGGASTAPSQASQPSRLIGRWQGGKFVPAQ